MKLSIYRYSRYTNDNLRFFNDRVTDRLSSYIEKSNELVPIEMIQYRNQIGFYSIDHTYVFTEQLKNVANYNSKMHIAFMGMINEDNRCMLMNTHYYLEKKPFQRFLYNSFHSFRKYYMKSTIQKINEYRRIKRIKSIKKISTFKYQHFVQSSFRQSRERSR